MPTPKTKPQGKRKLKIYEKSFPRTFHQYKIFPEISLSGKWLRDMGFECGKFVSVEYKEGEIVITIKEECR